MLAPINDVFNGVLVTGDAVGDVMFYGAGAGKLPTASAVVADIIDSAIHNERRKLIGWSKPETDTAADADAKKFRYFIRTSDDKETVKEVFKNVTEIECLAQTDFAFITEPLSVSELNKEKSKLGGIKTAIRVLD
jgi:homoserine dehydrogenase